MSGLSEWRESGCAGVVVSDGKDDRASTPGRDASAKPRGAGGRKPASDVAFDLWLERGLHAMFDEVAKEPIPPELLDLIEKDRQGE